MSKLILISGKSGHGKDCFGNILKDEFEHYGQKVLITHFADPVKWLAKQYFGYQGIKDTNDRHILQWLGTEIMRNYNDTYWSEIIGQFTAAMGRNNIFDVIIIPDLRFYSEYQTISTYCQKELMPLYTIRINRFNPDGTPYKNPNMTEEQLNHISECELDDFPTDFIINNDGQPETVEQAAHMIMRQILPNYKEFDNLEN